MYELIKSQYLFIQSKNRARGTPYDFEINFPDGCISCETSEVMAITLMNFDMPFNWYMVNETNNTFVFTNQTTSVSTTISIAHGNYPYRKLADTINEGYSGVYCSYLSSQNKLSFSFTQPHSISFIGKSYQILGFNSTDAPSGLNIESTLQLKQGTQVTEICLSLLGLAPYRDAFNMDTIGNSIQISNVLLAMPFSVNPFEMMSFRNLNNQNTMFFNNKKINSVRFTISDFDDNYLTYISDFTMTLKVETYAIDTMSEILNEKIESLLQINKLLLIQGRHR